MQLLTECQLPLSLFRRKYDKGNGNANDRCDVVFKIQEKKMIILSSYVFTSNFLILMRLQMVQEAFMPERSKGVHSSCIVFVLVGSNPTECIFLD